MPFPSPGDLPHLGIEPGSPTLQADALPSEPPGKAESYAIPSIGEWFASVGMLTTSQTLKCWKSDDINVTFCQGVGEEEGKRIVMPSYCGPSLGLSLELAS